MKIFKSKKAITPTIFAMMIVGLILAFGGAGIIKFLLEDKTPLIIGGIFVFLILFSKRKRGG